MMRALKGVGNDVINDHRSQIWVALLLSIPEVTGSYLGVETARD